jgi:hypothetical protein
MGLLPTRVKVKLQECVGMKEQSLTKKTGEIQCLKTITGEKILLTRHHGNIPEF